MFSVLDRDRLRDRVLEIASSDPRVVAGALLGSLAHDGGDKWSDIDLMFAVTDDVPVPEVLEDWSQTLVREVDAVKLFDLSSGPDHIPRVPAARFPRARPLIRTGVRVRRGRPEVSAAVLGCCSGKPSSQRGIRPRLRASCSDMPSTMRFMREPASSEADIGRRSTGSARFAIMPFTSPAEVEGSTATTVETSTSCPTTSWGSSRARSCIRWMVASSVVP